MSIYATIFECANDIEPDGDTQFKEPVSYHGSSLMPDAGERHGYFAVACIPDFVSRPSAKHPFLRISVFDIEVLLDLEQVQGLSNALVGWIVEQHGPIEKG